MLRYNAYGITISLWKCSFRGAFRSSNYRYISIIDGVGVVVLLLLFVGCIELLLRFYYERVFIGILIARLEPV